MPKKQGRERVRDEAATGIDSCPSGAPLPVSMLQTAAVHPGAQRVAWGICTCVVIALVGGSFWAAEVVAPGAGALPKPLLSPEAAVVARVLSNEGEPVQAGQVLVELTALHAGDRARAQLSAVAAEERLATALMVALQSGRAPVLSREAPAEERMRFQSAWRDLTTQLARFDAALQQQRIEGAALLKTITDIEASLPAASLRAADFERLVDDTAASAAQRQARVQERLQQERHLSAQQALLRAVQARLAGIERERADFVQHSLQRLGERRAAAAELRVQLMPGVYRPDGATRRIQLTAPFTGTVQQLAVPTEGAMVWPGEVLLTVAPRGGDAKARVAGPR